MWNRGLGEEKRCSRDDVEMKRPIRLADLAENAAAENASAVDENIDAFERFLAEELGTGPAIQDQDRV